MRSPVELAAVFRDSGRKVTPQRERVFRALHGNDEHPTAEAIHAAVVADMPTVSLRTVYQILSELSDLGEIDRIDLGTGSARFDPNVSPHHHLVCEHCGAIQDVNADISAIRLPAAQRDGFRVSGTEVVFRGTCRTCLHPTDNNVPREGT